MTQSLLWVRASNFFSRPSDCLLNVSIRAIRSGDNGVPGARGGAEISELIDKVMPVRAAKHAQAEAEVKRRIASRRAIICSVTSYFLSSGETMT
jgi:hypothetical protein